ncbi:PQQ-binding-like beta-propeller repeat protein [Candidatus Poribacteria bacterium]|nr:PQQ-binding-like beta-propeller repeat protein [Candidatus Poribacteria bacterium]
MRKTIWVISLSLISTCVCFTATAHAVIPQLIGPLTALLAIIPQILAFVGIAILTSLVFARDTTKMVFYKIRNFLTMRRIIVSLISLVILIGLSVLTFHLVGKGISNSTTPTAVNDTIPEKKEFITGKPWTTFRGNANRTGHVDDLPGPFNGTPSWIFKTKGMQTVQFLSSPAIVGNRLYIGAARGSVFSVSGATYCIDTDTQDVVWRHDSDIPIVSSPAVVAGRVYIGEGFHEDSGCRLRCLDAKTGDPIWSFRTASHVESTPFITQGRLYFSAGADGIYCLDALAGEEIWHFPAVHADISPLVKDGKVYFGTGYGQYKMYAVDAQTGNEIWSTPAPYSVWGNPSGYENLVFFGLGRGNFSESASIPAGKVVALNAETGDIAWEYEAEDAVLTAIAVHNGYVTFGSRDGYVYTLTATSGELHWRTYLQGAVVSSPAVTQDAVYAATGNGSIFSLSVNDGSIKWEYDTQNEDFSLNFMSSPAIANEKLYIGSNGRYIFCLGGTDPIKTIGDR